MSKTRIDSTAALQIHPSLASAESPQLARPRPDPGGSLVPVAETLRPIEIAAKTLLSHNDKGLGVSAHPAVARL